MSKGKIIQVMGPVVDVAFEDENLPHIKDALIVDNQGYVRIWRWNLPGQASRYR